MTRPFRYFVYGGITVSIVWGLLFFYLVNLQLENTWKHFKLPGVLDGRRHVKLQAREGARGAAYPGEIVRKNRNSGGPDLDDSPAKIAARLQERKNKETDIVELGIVRSEADNDLKNAGNRLYAFNQLISDRIGFFRDVPDFRAPGCSSKVYPLDLPTASVVICFYNEAWSVLLRTVYSVIDYTPPELLLEIILVNDHSDLNHLKEELNMFVTIHFSKVKVFHSAERLGLIRARMYGAGKAKGDVLVFLDSHCEVTKGWIEPLLARVQDDRRNVVLPIIDIISAETFKYEPSPLVRGGFNWGLHYRWDAVPKPRPNQTLTDPIQTPTMAGGLFAIERDYFFTMGQYDPGMEIWGGENLEMSFRIWQCGGRLEILPCSRVGHVFRHRRPYGDPKGQNSMSRNSLRVAHVWMDEYKEEFFKLNPDLRNTPYGDISERVKLRKRLGCKSFKWYLDNVYPEQVLSGKGKPPIMAGDRFPRKKGKITKRGLLKHDESGMCIEPVGGPYEKQSTLTLARCEEMSKRQTWYETDGSEMKLAATLCLDIDGMGTNDKVPRLMKCHGEAGSQEWHWSIKSGTSRLYNPSTGKCLSVSPGNGRYAVVMGICDQSAARTFHFL